MTMLIYERLEDFLDKLGKQEKTTTVYMTTVHAKKENNVLVASIRMQFSIGESSVFHTFNYKEGIQPVTLVPLDVFEMIPDEAQRTQAQKQYDAEIDAFHKSILDEYEKAKQLFNKMGYNDVVRAYTI